MNVFLNLDSSDFLIEYIYSDSISPEIISTDNAPFYFMANGHNNSSLLMNQDGLDNITNNTRNRSVVEIDSSSKQFALLTTNKLGLPYNDKDVKLTSSASLPLSFNVAEGVVYDTVRIHFIQGFSFNDYFSGINLNIDIKDKAGKNISLLSVIYKSQDSFETMNPNPFLYVGRQYSSYIEYKIPSLKYLINSYIDNYINQSNSDILSYKISNGSGFYQNTLLEITAGKFSALESKDNQYYTRRLTAESSSISSKDDFSDVGVYINESSDGDFIEFYGTYNGEIFGNYMLDLNNSSTGKYIVIHKLSITEQLPNTTSEYTLKGYYNPLTNIPDLSSPTYISNFTDGDYWFATESAFSSQINQNVSKGNFVVYNPLLQGAIKVEVIDSFDIDNYSDISQFIRTGTQEFIQDDVFGDINTFRPVLKYGGSALSYKIDYILQIYNTNTNITIEKSGSFISFEPNKYGKELIKINTRDNIRIYDVFNKKITTTIQNASPVTSNLIQDTALYSKNITSFKQIYSVYGGITEVSIDKNGKIVPKINPESVDNISGQGTATIYISPFDTFIQFGLYEQIDDKTFKSIDLNKMGTIYLNFVNKSGEIIKIESTKNQNVDESKGQILFKISSSLYNQIINSGNDIFYITSKVGVNSPETPLYTGKYKQYSQLVEDETQILIKTQRQLIKDLNNEIKELERKIKNNSVVLGPTGKGLTANDKSINKGSMVIKKSKFNPYGPTSVAGPTGYNIKFGPTSKGPTSKKK